MNYKSIKQETKLCRDAFKGAKVGDLVWFCHHDTPIEILNELPENRISYILFNKPKVERAIRLHWFRPCKLDLPPELDAARSALDAAQSKLDAARSAWNTPSSNLVAAHPNLNAAQSNLVAARSNLIAIYSEYTDEISALVKLHLPRCPWNGHTLFPEEKLK